MERIRKLPWLTISQWAFIGFALACAVGDSLTNHGFLMAIECFCVGFAVMGMLAVKRADTMTRLITEQDIIIGQMVRDFGRALESGRVEVFMNLTQPDVDHETTLH